MPKIKTGLLVQCAMRTARGASKETKERASHLEALSIINSLAGFRQERGFACSVHCLLLWYHSYHHEARNIGTTKTRTGAHRQGNASPGPLAAEAACKARCLDKEAG